MEVTNSQYHIRRVASLKISAVLKKWKMEANGTNRTFEKLANYKLN
jgi:hypothetical protein